jgi:hypothetical protein
MVARREILRNHGRNYNSPETGCESIVVVVDGTLSVELGQFRLDHDQVQTEEYRDHRNFLEDFVANNSDFDWFSPHMMLDPTQKGHHPKHPGDERTESGGDRWPRVRLRAPSERTNPHPHEPRRARCR